MAKVECIENYEYSLEHRFILVIFYPAVISCGKIVLNMHFELSFMFQVTEYSSCNIFEYNISKKKKEKQMLKLKKVLPS